MKYYFRTAFIIGAGYSKKEPEVQTEIRKETIGFKV